MAKTIRKGIFGLAYESERSLLYAAGISAVYIFDVGTKMSLKGKLKGVKNVNQIYIDETNNIIIVKSITGEFGVFNRETFELLYKFKLRNVISGEADFVYDEKAMLLCTVMTFCKKSRQGMYYKLAFCNVRTKEICYVGLDSDKTENKYDKYSIYKIEDGKALVLHSATDLINDTPEGSLLEYELVNGKPKERTVLKNNLDWGLAYNIGQQLLNSFCFLFDMQDQTITDVREKLNIQSYVNKVRISGDSFVVFLADEIIVCDKDFNVLRGYKDFNMTDFLKTDTHTFVATKEKLVVYDN